MNKEELKTLLLQLQNKVYSVKGVKRECEDEIYSALTSKPIKIITGFRRSGKSFLTQQIAARAIKAGMYEQSNVLYLNFENFHLSEINTPKALNEVYQLFNTEIANKGKVLCIFDEIQHVSDWDKFIRTIYENDGNTNIIITGSNSELLSAELGSNLAGRFIEFFLYPFSFREYLSYHDITVASENDLYRNMANLKRLFNDFLTYGGLPESFSISMESTKFTYLQGIVSKVILDDVIERFSVRQPWVIDKMLAYLLLNSGNIVSFSKLAAFVKVLGQSMNQETVITYVSYLMKALAIYEIQKFDWKINRVFETTRKYYAVDTGIVNLQAGLTSNYSKLLENIVFLELRRRGKTIYFGMPGNAHEIDFIVTGCKREMEKIQITTKLGDENMKRELNPFAAADPYLKKGQNIVLSMQDHDEELKYNNVAITRKNLIKWLIIN